MYESWNASHQSLPTKPVVAVVVVGTGWVFVRH